MTAGRYIKVAMIMSVVCIAVIFWLVYRLLQVPTEQQTAVALQASQSAATAMPAVTTSPVPATATPSNAIFAVANAYPNVHTAAGLSTTKVGVLNRGDRAEVLGRTPDSVWLQIRYPSAPNGVGWVSADLMTLTTPGAAIPVVTSP